MMEVAERPARRPAQKAAFGSERRRSSAIGLAARALAAVPGDPAMALLAANLEALAKPAAWMAQAAWAPAALFHASQEALRAAGEPLALASRPPRGALRREPSRAAGPASACHSGLEQVAAVPVSKLPLADEP